MNGELWSDDITLTYCLQYFGELEFCEKLLEELADRYHDLPLLDCCMHEGSPAFEKGVDVEDLQISQMTDAVVKGSFHVAFLESYYGGCRDLDFFEPHKGRIHFSLHPKTGNMSFDERPAKREFDPEEI